MEFEKKYFNVYRQGREMTDQFYLDEDFNVPDMKRDVQRIVLSEGKIQIEDMKCVENYVRVTGDLLFKILYVTDEGETKITALDGKLPFEEMVYMEEEPLEVFVTEDDYEGVRRAVADVLGYKDDYLEVFLPDMAYSDTPIKKCISEDLADIYQDLKDFIGVFQLGMNASMNDALCVCKEHFAEFWGQRLVNTMRALHDVKYNATDEADQEYDY